MLQALLLQAQVQKATEQDPKMLVQGYEKPHLQIQPSPRLHLQALAIHA